MTSPTNAIRVASKNELKEGASRCVTAGGKALTLFLVNGTYYATDNVCPHAGGPLCEGSVKDGIVTCPWHGSQFNVADGKVVHGPAQINVATYPVEVRGDDVYVNLSQMMEGTAKPKAVQLRTL
jgi:nitrite reductase/ring-hydroxylating ferredoxin subunit